MFVKVVPNNKGRKGTSFIYLTESYREDGKVKRKRRVSGREASAFLVPPRR